MAGSASSRHDLLSRVVPASSMPVFAHERLLCVPDALIPLFTGVDDARTASPVGLVRGQTVMCTGSAAVSCALGLAAGVTKAGSWAAFVDVPSIGLLAAATIGVSLERAVFVSRLDGNFPAGNSSSDDTNGTRRDEARRDVGSALSALIDVVDLIVASRRLISALPSSLTRRLQSRVQSKGSVLLIIDDPPSLRMSSISTDLRLTARAIRWEGVGEGHGHLRRRLVSIDMDGRRCPRPRTHVVWLPDATGGMSSVSDVPCSGIPDSGTNIDDTSVESGDAVVIALRRGLPT